MQMSGRSSECMSVCFCGCEFKTLEVAEGSCCGLQTSCTSLTNLCKCATVWTCRLSHAHACSGQANIPIYQLMGVRALSPSSPSPLCLTLFSCTSPLHNSLTFSVKEMINGSSEEARDKATRADGREKKHHLYQHLRRASRLLSLQTARERRWDKFHSLCFSFIPSNIQALGKRNCHLTLSLSSKDKLFCSASVLCDKQLVFIQPPIIFILWFLCVIKVCVFSVVCYLLLWVQSLGLSSMHQHKLLVVWRTFFFELQQKKPRKVKGKLSKQPCSEQHGSPEHRLKMWPRFVSKLSSSKLLLP